MLRITAIVTCLAVLACPVASQAQAGKARQGLARRCSARHVGAGMARRAKAPHG